MHARNAMHCGMVCTLQSEQAIKSSTHVTIFLAYLCAAFRPLPTAICVPCLAHPHVCARKALLRAEHAQSAHTRSVHAPIYL
jgi:hypothetical protein